MASPSSTKARGVAAGRKVVGGMKDLWHLAKKDFTDNSKELRHDFAELLEVARAKRSSPKDPRQPTFLLNQAVNVDAGAELLTRYKEEWSLIHRRTEEASQASADLDTQLQGLHCSVAQSHTLISECWKEFKQLPEVIRALEVTKKKVQDLGRLLSEVEDSIVECSRVQAELETVRRKDSLKIQFGKQSVKMERELEHLQETLSKEKRQKGEVEREIENQKVQERQQAFQEMFQQQMADYRETGSIERAIGVEERERSTSQLEDMVIEDKDGTASLNEFLSDVDITAEEESPEGSHEPSSKSHDTAVEGEGQLENTVPS